jgi:hypothetical protein
MSVPGANPNSLAEFSDTSPTMSQGSMIFGSFSISSPKRSHNSFDQLDFWASENPEKWM